MSDIKAKEYKNFEKIKHRDENGVEYWLARELASVLEYVQWRNFERVIERAMLACKNSGFNTADQFAEVSKLVEHGSGAKRQIIDFMNSSELAANLFRITLADEKIKKENIVSPNEATHAHNIVGQEVRGAIRRAGAILPEDQPTPEKSVEQIAREQIKLLKKKNKLMLDE